MPTERNIQAVAELEQEFKSSPLVIAAEYRGLDVNEMQGMRRAVRESSSQFKIAKNTLARIAADNAGRPELKEFIDGPIGFLTSTVLERPRAHRVPERELAPTPRITTKSA